MAPKTAVVKEHLPISVPQNWSGVVAVFVTVTLWLSGFIAVIAGIDSVQVVRLQGIVAFVAFALLVQGDLVSRVIVPALLLLVIGWWGVVAAMGLYVLQHPYCDKAKEVLELVPRSLMASMKSGAVSIVWGVKQRRLALAAVLAVNAITACFVLCQLPADTTLVGIDGQWYRSVAQNILNGRGMIAKHPADVSSGLTQAYAARMPLYPLIIAGAEKALGADGWKAVSYTQVVSCTLLASFLVFLLAESLAGTSAGMIGGLLFALYVPIRQLSPMLLTEYLAIPLYLGICLVAVKAWQSERVWLWVVVGGLIGTATLLRPNTILTVPLYAIILVASALKLKSWRPVSDACLLILAFSFTMAPWWFRNYQVLGSFVPTSTIGGFHAWAGSYAPYKGRLREGSHIIMSEELALHGGNEVAADKAMYSRFHQELSPKVLWLVPPRFEELVLKPERPSRLHGTMLWLAVFGLAALRKNKGVLPAFAFVASVVFVHLATYAESRYFVPLMPICIVWAAAAVGNLLPTTLGNCPGQTQ